MRRSSRWSCRRALAHFAAGAPKVRSRAQSFFRRPAAGGRRRGAAAASARAHGLYGARGAARPPSSQVELADELAQLLGLARQRLAAAVLCSAIAAFCCVAVASSPTACLISATECGLFARRQQDVADDHVSFRPPWRRCARALRRWRLTCCTPPATSVVAAATSALISLAASAERCASPRTSEATTAKPLARVAGARRLDAGVERQQIGLERDLVDGADDLADVAGGFLDPHHRVDRLADDLVALLGLGLPPA